ATNIQEQDRHLLADSRNYYTRVAAIVHRFFFSSRRRHTRCYRDWSSDVCSSDLLAHREQGTRSCHRQGRCALAARQLLQSPPLRSEERRVGKECRSHWPADHYKKERSEHVVRAASGFQVHILAIERDTECGVVRS